MSEVNNVFFNPVLFAGINAISRSASPGVKEEDFAKLASLFVTIHFLQVVNNAWKAFREARVETEKKKQADERVHEVQQTEQAKERHLDDERNREMEKDRRLGQFRNQEMVPFAFRHLHIPA